MVNYLQKLLLCFIDAGFAWSQRRATTLSAAISYYTMLSLAPILLVAVAIVGFIVGTSDAIVSVVRQIELFFGPEVADFVRSLIQTTSQPTSVTLVTIISVVVTLFAASGVFNQMQVAFNIIWDVSDEEEGIRLTIVRR
ncbi:MAG: YihY/virulence factor BrkB family protein, partial [Anaerolineales bacterium]|nr:YihY/virulence factor BrkB family protein [Anaerolineales bacterium]